VGASERGLQALHATVCIVLVILDPGQTFICGFALIWGFEGSISGLMLSVACVFDTSCEAMHATSEPG
jgi:hypothetical protein